MAQFTDIITQEYYDSFSDVYASVWSSQMHTGYFGKKKSLEKACADMNVFLATKAKLKRGCKVLSVGCGRGGGDRFLAKKLGATVIGLDLSVRQLEEALAAAREAGLEKQVTYLCGSMTTLPLIDGSVDCVWVQEALFHCHDKLKAAQEFSRVLKPGGVVVLEDSVLNYPGAKKEVMAIFGNRVHINDISTPSDYEHLFKQAGLKLTASKDLTSHLLTTYEVILDYIRKNREKIRGKIDKKYWAALDNDFDRPKTTRLVAEKKLGCIAMFFRK
ncbi:MAG: methyltransferase domain-containing protein [Candidatus Magasanikbacteria bacterium]|nr:methyltransferase domain-containing protein [Candidatus Magasanikbacteria bacterium]